MTFIPQDKPLTMKAATVDTFTPRGAPDDSALLRKIQNQLRMTQIALCFVVVILVGIVLEMKSELNSLSLKSLLSEWDSGQKRLVVDQLVAGSIVTPYLRVVDSQSVERITMVCPVSNQPAIVFRGLHDSKVALGIDNNNDHDEMFLSMTPKSGKGGITIGSSESRGSVLSSARVSDGSTYAHLIANGETAEMAVKAKDNPDGSYGVAAIEVDKQGRVDWTFRDSKRKVLFEKPPQ